jgi:hypothetical protein
MSINEADHSEALNLGSMKGSINYKTINSVSIEQTRYLKREFPKNNTDSV